MKKILILPILILLIISVIGIVSANQVSITKENQGNPGSIWTTRDDCGNEQQNVNQYYIGEDVYINGKNFNPGNYNWEIKGQPSGASCDPNLIIANGTITTENGNFCFNAYTIQDDDCREYKVTLNNKHDNYHVIPEFGLIAGIVTVLSAITIFFIIRRK